MAPLRSEVEFESYPPLSFDTIFEATGNFSSTKNKRVCDIMASRSENFLGRNSDAIPALTNYDAEFSQQMLQGAESSFQMPLGADTEKQQSKQTTKSSESTKRAKLATITLEEYMNVFNRLTGGEGNVVQPICDIKLFTCDQLRSVLRLNGLRLQTGKAKDNLLLSMVGVELWNPFTLFLGQIEPANITDEEMLEDLQVLQW